MHLLTATALVRASLRRAPPAHVYQEQILMCATQSLCSIPQTHLDTRRILDTTVNPL